MLPLYFLRLPILYVHYTGCVISVVYFLPGTTTTFWTGAGTRDQAYMRLCIDTAVHYTLKNLIIHSYIIIDTVKSYHISSNIIQLLAWFVSNILIMVTCLFNWNKNMGNSTKGTCSKVLSSLANRQIWTREMTWVQVSVFY